MSPSNLKHLMAERDRLQAEHKRAERNDFTGEDTEMLNAAAPQQPSTARKPRPDDAHAERSRRERMARREWMLWQAKIRHREAAARREESLQRRGDWSSDWMTAGREWVSRSCDMLLRRGRHSHHKRSDRAGRIGRVAAAAAMALGAGLVGVAVGAAAIVAVRQAVADSTVVHAVADRQPEKAGSQVTLATLLSGVGRPSAGDMSHAAMKSSPVVASRMAESEVPASDAQIQGQAQTRTDRLLAEATAARLIDTLLKMGMSVNDVEERLQNLLDIAERMAEKFRALDSSLGSVDFKINSKDMTEQRLQQQNRAINAK